MKVTTLLAGIALVAVVSAESDSYNSSKEDDYDYSSDEYEDNEDVAGWFVPTANGDFYWMTKEEWDQFIEPQVLGLAEFYLYTNLNPEHATRLYPGKVDSITKSNFDIKNPTRFIIHGFLNNVGSDINVAIRKAFVIADKSNVIVVDWSSMSSLIYPIARAAVPHAGEKVAEFIDFLNTKISVPPENLTLIGHSLGAHVAGFAGKKVKTGKVGVIIGLDPAGPLFIHKDKSTRLCDEDAKYVETSHTSSKLGMRKPIGHASFYPNGGLKQPGCLAETCSHLRAYWYYSESVLLDNFRSFKCETPKPPSSKCGNEFSDVRMGSLQNRGIKGLYYVPVKATSPYADS